MASILATCGPEARCQSSLDDVDTRHPDLARLIGDGSVAAYGVNRALVTLGDAAHLMPPLGAGANLAMVEGAELAESIAAGPEDLDEVVRAFEEQMWARAGRWATITLAGLERLVSPDPTEALALFDEVQPS